MLSELKALAFIPKIFFGKISCQLSDLIDSIWQPQDQRRDLPYKSELNQLRKYLPKLLCFAVSSDWDKVNIFGAFLGN